MVLVRPVDWTRIVEAIPILLLSGDIRWSEVRRFRARHLRFSTSRPAMAHSAGDIVGLTPIEIEVLPRAISIVVPNQSAVTGRKGNGAGTAGFARVVASSFPSSCPI